MKQAKTTNVHESFSGVPHSIHYRPDIDGLRALAILSVVLYHAFPTFLTGGFVGVDIFFVISGFLISSIVFKEAHEGRYSHVRFYARRIKRIFPALSIVLLSCLMLGGYFLFKDEFKSLGKHIIAGSAFLSNFALTREGGYFDASAESKPLLHLWSLSIEEQFYIFWPLLIVAIWKLPKKYVLSVIISLTLLSFIANLYLVDTNSSEAFYLPFGRFWELSIGALLAYATHFRAANYALPAPTSNPTPKRNVISHFFRTLRIKNPVYKHGLSIIGLIAILISLIESKNDSFPGWIALLPTLGTVAVIESGPSSIINRHLLSTKIAIFIGLISYPLYLWHWPLLVFAKQIFPYDTKYIISLIAIGVAFILSILTYRFIEHPARTSKSLGVLPITLSLTMIIEGSLGVLAYKNILPLRLDSESVNNIMVAVDDWYYPTGKLDNFKKNGGFNTLKIEGAQKNKILFIGDSHIEQYWPRIDAYSKILKHDFPTTVFATSGGCPPLPMINRTQSGFSCNLFFDFASHLAQSGEYRTVVFGAFWEGYFGFEFQNSGDPIVYRTDDNNRRAIKINSKQATQTFSDFAALIRKLTSNNIKVYIILSNPSSPFFDPKIMINRLTGSINHYDIKKSTFLNETSPVTNTLLNSLKSAGASILDPINDLCHGDLCQSVNNKGVPIYKDKSHIRSSFARYKIHFLDEIYSHNVIQASLIDRNSSSTE
jgi:peptidoglycan/LPS O-acetylase OafA/YrhL